MKLILNFLYRYTMKEKILFLVLIIAIWPSLFHICDLLQQKTPKKLASINSSALISPVILVFDREAYFPKITFQVSYLNGEAEIINLDSRLFSEFWPYPVSVMIAHIFTGPTRREIKIKGLDAIFCKKLLKSFVPKYEVSTVAYQADYLFEMPVQPEILRHACLP